MDLDEYNLIENQLCKLGTGCLNTFEFLEKAQDKGVLKEKDVQRITCVLSVKDDAGLIRLRSFLFELAKCMSFSDFAVISEMVGLEIFAEGLKHTRRTSKDHISKHPMDTFSIPRMTKETHDSTILINLFCKQKAVVDNKLYPDLKQHFNDLTSRTFTAIKDCENVRQRNNMANQLAVITWLQTQLYRDVEKRTKILRKFWASLAALVTDTSFIETVYYCKLACTSVLRGDFDQAVAYITQAEMYAENSKWAFARTVVHHDRQFIYRKQNVKQKDSKNVSEIIRNCERGMDSLTDNNSSDHVLLLRIFILNMAQALLGIGTYLEIDVKEPVLNPSIKRADELLEEVEQLSEIHEMENRRKMLFYLCKGRLADLKNLKEEANGFVEEAKQLSNEGAILRHQEKKSLEAYSASMNISS